MELIPLDAQNRKAWNEFCLQSPDAWFWHTTDWLEWNLAYRPELRSRSLSFLCREGSKILAVAPLILTEHEDGARKWKAFSLSGNHLPGPALPPGISSAERDGIMEFVFGGIDDIAEELGVAHSKFRIDALRPNVVEPRYAPYNSLLKHDLIDCTEGTQLIDLRLSRSELRDGLRRNHVRSIEKGKELFSIKLHSGRDLTDAKFEEYVAMHGRAAGRVTRPRSTFNMMRSWIQSGRGLVAEALTKDGVTAGFELYILYKKSAYGLSACNEPEYEHLPIRHQIEWEAMNWMRKQGVQFYEIGPQHFGILPYDFPTPKNIGISHFKYGFGGETVPYYLAERFYSAEHWRVEVERRNARFAELYPFKPASRGEQGRALLARLDAADSSPLPADRLDESAPIPEALLELAASVLRDHPEAVAPSAAGDVRTLHFLVGKAIRLAGKAHPPLLVRRAIEHSLAQKR
jgi:hypothetical protein